MHIPNIDRITKAGFWFLVILSIFFAILSLAALKAMGQIGSGVPVSNTITVSGEGEVFAVPDIAEFTLSVVEERQDVAAVQKAAGESINAIIEFLEDNNIEDEDIRTIAYNLYPRYEYRQEQVECFRAPCPPQNTRVLAGYEVRQSISVKVRETDDAGPVLAGVGSLGATDVSGLNFTIDDEEELQVEAREKAIEDAREKAEELANDLDVDLVRVVSFSEGSGPQPFYGRGFGGAVDFAVEESIAVAPDIPLGENQITSNVSITYEIR